ncbi:ABC transporter ATP-binding protein [Bradyrhizobium sp.]|jgi:sulfonate transport system ATP-binding protein|uniref:ABC transporter ATP-binding protein n=1 Tax=Bradyrhizobium sp. TaxID=376 RepID=UPI003C279F84
MSGHLDVQHVSKRFQVDGKPIEALSDISLSIQPGEFVSIVGPSGCGKSTLLRLLAGLDRGFEGNILHDGKPIVGTSLDRGIVFQEPRLFPWATVRHNIGLGLQNAPIGRTQKEEMIEAHVRLVGLQGFERAYPHQLSGGMAQRAAIARGLVNRPQILLLDEPFGALDAMTRGKMQIELQQIWAHEKITMVLVTHDVDEAVFLGDRVIVLAPRPGRISRIFEVTTRRPRQRTDDDLIHVRNEILLALEAQEPKPSPLARSTGDLIERPAA